MTLPEWCYSLHSDVFNWLMRLRDRANPGRFMFCLEGGISSLSEKAGLDSSALALKICYMAGALGKIPPEELKRWTDHIRSFQKEKEPGNIPGLKRASGFFIDEEVIGKADRRAGRFMRDRKIRRAVTRQACAALICAGTGPAYPVMDIPGGKRSLERFLDGLDWERDPWDAGSHVSHLIFFLKMNKDFFGAEEQYDNLTPFIFDYLESLRNTETGSWYRGNPPVEQKINSGMKVLTAYAVIDKELDKPEALIDFCLDHENTFDGCHNADILYVLHYCNKYSDHRRREIEEFCRRRVGVIEQFRKPDGAFSFHRDGSQTAIYGIPVSKGFPESDIHGTVLFMWSLKMIADILGCSGGLPWKMPVN